jgi:hypothetical protein
MQFSLSRTFRTVRAYKLRIFLILLLLYETLRQLYKFFDVSEEHAFLFSSEYGGTV